MYRPIFLCEWLKASQNVFLKQQRNLDLRWMRRAGFYQHKHYPATSDYSRWQDLIHHAGNPLKRTSRIRRLDAANKSATIPVSKSMELGIEGRTIEVEAQPDLFPWPLKCDNTFCSYITNTWTVWAVLRCYSSKVITNFTPALEASARILADSRCARAWINLASASCWASRKWQNKDQYKATGVLVQNLLCDWN